MAVEQTRDRKLGTHPIGARDQDRVLHVLEASHGKARTKAAQAPYDLKTSGGAHRVLDGVNGTGPLAHVHTRVGVAHVPLLLNRHPRSSQAAISRLMVTSDAYV